MIVPVATSKLLIRKGTQDDRPRIVEMAKRFIRGTSYASLFKVVPEALDLYVGQVLEHGVVFVAERDGELLGFLAAFAMVEPIGRLKVLDELAWWVDPHHRRGSVGPRLLHAAEVWGRQKGLDLIKMIAPEDTDVGRFYKRAGYQPIETAFVKRLGR